MKLGNLLSYCKACDITVYHGSIKQKAHWQAKHTCAPPPTTTENIGGYTPKHLKEA